MSRTNICDPCPPHITVERTDRHGNTLTWCVQCEHHITYDGLPTRLVSQAAMRTDHDVAIVEPERKASCMACVVGEAGFEAAHVCGYPDDVAAASGVA